MDEDFLDGDRPETVMLTATDEFCRNLGSIPTYGQAGNRVDALDDDTLMVRIAVLWTIKSNSSFLLRGPDRSMGIIQSFIK